MTNLTENYMLETNEHGFYKKIVVTSDEVYETLLDILGEKVIEDYKNECRDYLLDTAKMLKIEIDPSLTVDEIDEKITRFNHPDLTPTETERFINGGWADSIIEDYYKDSLTARFKKGKTFWEISYIYPEDLEDAYHEEVY